MCHNHSHAKAELLASVMLDNSLHAIWYNMQDFTIETRDGEKLTQPAGSIFLTPFLTKEDLSAFLRLQTGALSASSLLLGDSAELAMDTLATSYKELLSRSRTP